MVLLAALLVATYVALTVWKTTSDSSIAHKTEIIFASNSVPVEREVTWKELRGLDYTTGMISSTVQSVNRQPVRILGFMVPLADNLDSFSEFLIVPDAMACIHAPPPAPNQMVYVKASQNIPLAAAAGYPFWFEGELHVEPIRSSYGTVTYSLRIWRLRSVMVEHGN